ncbi:Early growth response protein 1 [Atta colombica]|uniref:Early growth response protein 1 n=1 Tax=Atta colombica TaxID=520822 RepID=A0A195BHK2_9HYME|nr:Early growth response protein 1 [Atta colombica]
MAATALMTNDQSILWHKNEYSNRVSLRLGDFSPSLPFFRRPPLPRLSVVLIDEVGGSTVVAEGVVGGIRGPSGGCRASSMTMAESAVEDAAAAPPGPAKPPPPSCTNNNTLAATANRNHRNPRKKRRRLEQVVDTLQAHRSSPSEGEVLKFEGSGPVSEEEDVFGSPRSSSSRSAVDTTAVMGQLPLRLKDAEAVTSTEEEFNEISQQYHYPHRPYCYSYHHHHRHRYSPYQNNHRLSATKYSDCTCNQCSLAASAAMMLPSATSLQTPLSRTSFTYSSICGTYSIFEQYMHTKYLSSSSGDIFRGRSHSDSDVVSRWDETRVPAATTSFSSVVNHPPRSGSLESDSTSPQESPLDLSMKNLMLQSTAAASAVANRSPALQLLPSGIVTRGSVSVPVVRGDVASPTTKKSVAVRYNLEVLPVVEEMAPGADVAYVCPECGQMFSLHDRLAKHMASRHRRQGLHDASAKAYLCDVCQRSFARSDMLTRHMRLHTGVKPYTCRVCRQVFSRSDHLSTHQRTHTGEKPYKCPQCAYAACRRDMITRHLKTHNRCADGPIPKTEPGLLTGEECSTFDQNVAAPSAVIKAE